MTHPLADRRILFVLPTLDLGGAERQAVLLAGWLKRHAGADVAVAALFGGTGRQAVRAMCIERHLPSLRFSMPAMHGNLPTGTALRQLVRELRYLRPSLIMPYVSTCNVVCGLTWQRSGADACIWNQRDAGIDLPPERPQLRAAARASLFVANSPPAAGCLTERLAVPNARIRIVPNGVSLGRPKLDRRAWRRSLNIADDLPIACMLANIQRHKDHLTLLRAWAQVCRDLRPAPALVLAGAIVEGEAELRGVIEAAGIGRQVRFAGPVDDVAGLLGACDVGVLSSQQEGLPNAVLESMAAGLPVAATDLPGIRYALPPKQWDYLAPPGDDTTMAGVLTALLGDVDARRRLGAINRAHIQQKFSLRALGVRSVEVLSEVLGRTGPLQHNIV